MRTELMLLIAALPIFAGCTQLQPEYAHAPAEHTVEITPLGFNPPVLKIAMGETVKFVNRDKLPHWPASNAHPAHGEYPQGGGCIGSAFDACGPLKTNETFSFTFDRKGEWGYHDHLNSELKGKIIVE